MKRLYVFADFDWLKEPRLIGELIIVFVNRFISTTCTLNGRKVIARIL